MTEFRIIVAMSEKDHIIGVNEKMPPWRLPSDLGRFKGRTMDKPVIVGRKTFSEIVKLLGGPLPGRRNIVITGNPETVGWIRSLGAEPVMSYVEAQSKVIEDEVAYVVGGAGVYRSAIPTVNKMEITYVSMKKPQGALTLFPKYEQLDWHTEYLDRRMHKQDGSDTHYTQRVLLTRIR
jgi:dihydrofolate reductase